MNVQEILYFSPKYKFIDLDWNTKSSLIKAFQDRANGFYIDPAKALNGNENHANCAFAIGVLCVATIDFLARIETGSDDVGWRFESWLKSYIKEFNIPNPDEPSQSLARRFYDEFRNGLVHEGRIKNAGQFSYYYDELVKVQKLVMIVNPECLLLAIDQSLKGYIEKIEKNEYMFNTFKDALIKDFQIDVERLNR